MEKEKNHIGRIIRINREQAGLSRGPLVSKVGYINLNKGIRMIEAIESGDSDFAGIVDKIIAILSISEVAAVETARLDREDLERGGSLIEPVLTIRWMPAVYQNHPLPVDLQELDELEKYACDLARKMDKKVHLVLPTRVALWIESNGEIAERSRPNRRGIPDRPTSTLGGH